MFVCVLVSAGDAQRLNDDISNLDSELVTKFEGMFFARRPATEFTHDQRTYVTITTCHDRASLEDWRGNTRSAKALQEHDDRLQPLSSILAGIHGTRWALGVSGFTRLSSLAQSIVNRRKKDTQDKWGTVHRSLANKHTNQMAACEPERIINFSEIRSSKVWGCLVLAAIVLTAPT